MKIVLGLGSNWGDRMDHLRKTVSLLRSPFNSPRINVIAISPLYESEALLPEGAPVTWNKPYLNLCILCETKASPLEVLHMIKKMEEKIGRQIRGRWAPREIDVDILVWDSFKFQSPKLTIPHPGLLERPFAILPLADLFPDWKILQGPSEGQTAKQFVSNWIRATKGCLPFNTKRSQRSLPELVGILNITPDSFSDGGQLLQTDAVAQRAEHFLSNGIDILDVGAESTRPTATVISPKEEWLRLEPALRVLKAIKLDSIDNPNVILSIDTRHAETAAKAIQAGADWINDVTGLSSPEMRKVVADSHASVVMMHSLTVPPQSNLTLSEQTDAVPQLLSWAEQRIEDLKNIGIGRERVIFDPGLGFGKTLTQTWEILRDIQKFRELGVRILVGHSRKSFLASLTTKPAPERDYETLALSMELVKKGVDYVRIHAAEMHARALKTWMQINGVIE